MGRRRPHSNTTDCITRSDRAQNSQILVFFEVPIGISAVEHVEKLVEEVASPRRLPITYFAHKAGVVPNNGVRASLAARDVATERGRPTGLDRRDRSQLAEANVPLVGCTPRGSMGAQNVRHLHGLSCLASAAAQGPQPARQELLSGYRTLRPGLPIGSDFVPWHIALLRHTSASRLQVKLRVPPLGRGPTMRAMVLPQSSVLSLTPGDQKTGVSTGIPRRPQ